MEPSSPVVKLEEMALAQVHIACISMQVCSPPPRTPNYQYRKNQILVSQNMHIELIKQNMNTEDEY